MTERFQVAGNELVLLQNGTAYFPQLCADIEAAQHFIYLESYIFAADNIGRQVADALQNEDVRGVAVHVLLDGFGSADLPESWVESLRFSGVQLQWFRREIFHFNFRRQRLRRLHRKLVVIDGETAFVGGINILSDVPENDAFAAPRFDYAVRVQGALVSEIQAAMQHVWNVVAWAHLRKRVKPTHKIGRKKSSSASVSKLSFVLRDNLRHRRDIERAYLNAIGSAQQEIILANAYFLPGRLFRRALILAAKRGVRVVLLLQGKVEFRLQHYATQALYEQFLAAGIEIYEYQPSYLHAKVAVIDGRWATVGSSNIDPFSLMLAREANLVIADAEFAQTLRASLLAVIAQSATRIDQHRWNKLGLRARVVTRFCYLAVRLAMGLLGYRKRVV